MAFLAQIGLWIISDIRHIIIVVLSVLLIGMEIYAQTLKWQVADKDSKISTYKSENDRLTLNNTNLTAQVTQLEKANKACNVYVGKIFNAKDRAAKVNDRINNMKGQQDEVILHNDIVSSWNAVH